MSSLTTKESIPDETFNANQENVSNAKKRSDTYRIGNIPLFVFDLLLFPIHLVRMVLIYFWGSKYNLKGFQFLDVIMHADNPYFNQEDCRLIDTIGTDYRIVIRDDSRIFPMDMKSFFGLREYEFDEKTKNNSGTEKKNVRHDLDLSKGSIEEHKNPGKLSVTIGSTDGTEIVSKRIIDLIGQTGSVTYNNQDKKTVEDWDINSDKFGDDIGDSKDNLNENNPMNTLNNNNSSEKNTNTPIKTHNIADEKQHSLQTQTVFSKTKSNKRKRIDAISDSDDDECDQDDESIDENNDDKLDLEKDDASTGSKRSTKKKDDILDSIREELDSVFEN